jgi:trans-aconitate methyltransferase
LLVDQLRPDGYRRYVGIDVAEAAIAAAAPRRDEHTSFLAADAETFRTDERFDLIVLNESIYYFRDALGTVQRYEALLAPDGSFIVSMFDGLRARAIARQLLRRYRLREETSVSNRKGTWLVRVLAPPG